MPLHEGQKIDENRESTEKQRQCDVAFAAFAFPVLLAIGHDHNAGTGGSETSFSTMSDANSAAR